jgi:hypothetical protein
MITFLAVLAAVTWIALRTSGACLSWGPGIHIQATRRVLEQIRRRRHPRPGHSLVLAHTDTFLYGNVAADLINFKNYGGMKNNCHNWNIQDRLRVLAETDREKAFVYGYLCHLAADVISHNHFIPYHRVRGIPPLFLAHTYWEALADASVDDDEWDLIRGLRHNRELHRHDRLIWEAVRWRALGPRSNKWIWSNILLLSLRSRWRDLIRLARARRGRHPIDGEFLRHCVSGCVHNMLDVFDEERLSVLKLRDPTGRTALRNSRFLRRDILLRYGRTEDGMTASKRIAREAYWILKFDGPPSPEGGESRL